MSAERIKTTTLRLRRVRFKSGGEITVLRPDKADPVRDHIGKTLCDLQDNFTAKLAGFAIVVWDVNGLVFVDYENGQNSGVAAGGVAEYAKNILASEQILRWAKE